MPLFCGTTRVPLRNHKKREHGEEKVKLAW